MNTYDIGDRVRCECEFKLDETLTDPSSVVFRMKTPDGETTSYTYGDGSEVVRESEGVFYVDWDVSAAGGHYYRWEGDGVALKAVSEGAFSVRTSRVV